MVRAALNRAQVAQLSNLLERVRSSTEATVLALDVALVFVAASNARIAAMEAKADEANLTVTKH